MMRAKHFPWRLSSPVRRVWPAIAADLLLFLVFLYLALGSASSSGSSTFTEALEGQPDPLPPARAVVQPGLGNLKVDLADGLAEGPADVAIALRDETGDIVLDVEADMRFVLASVSKLYILAAYLDIREQEGDSLDTVEVGLLDDMIRYSDNASATLLWRRIGQEDGLDTFLAENALAPLDLVEKDAWGTINATAGEVSELLWRLVTGRLLGPDGTMIARDLLSDVFPEQAWGVSAGASPGGPAVMLKNGWYPESEGWRVNSAGVIQGAEGSYVLVILAYPAPSLEEGITLLEDVARRINAFIGE